MKIEFLPDRNITLVYCSPPIGNFGLEHFDGHITVWDHCREQFAVKYTEKIAGFYMSHNQGVGNNIARFLTKFERIVKTSGRYKNMKYSKFAKTNNPLIIYIEPSDFWRNCYFKRSLLTILVRCGMNYDFKKDNFDDALFSVDYKESTYLKETKPAVLRFMFGFTHYNGVVPPFLETTVLKHGWREEFQKLDETAIRNRLILPPGIKKQPNIVGAESLWV